MLAGCSAALVPESNDPGKKLSQANELLALKRSVPAERLVREAMAMYTEQNDLAGLANAKREYGLLLVHPSYRLYEKFWRENGQYDPTNGSAITSMESSLDLYKKVNDPEGKRAVALQLGRLHAEDGNAAKACILYNDSISYHIEARKTFPNHNFYVMAGTNSFEETIAILKAKVSCA